MLKSPAPGQFQGWSAISRVTGPPFHLQAGPDDVSSPDRTSPASPSFPLAVFTSQQEVPTTPSGEVLPWAGSKPSRAPALAHTKASRKPSNACFSHPGPLGISIHRMEGQDSPLQAAVFSSD